METDIGTYYLGMGRLLKQATPTRFRLVFRKRLSVLKYVVIRTDVFSDVSGQDYNPESLTRLLSLSQPQLFAEHKGCGILPVVVRNNRADRFGGGLFQVSSLSRTPLYTLPKDGAKRLILVLCHTQPPCRRAVTSVWSGRASVGWAGLPKR